MFLIDSDGVLMKPRVHGNTGRQIEIAKVNTLIVDVLMVVTGRWGGQGKKGVRIWNCKDFLGHPSLSKL